MALILQYFRSVLFIITMYLWMAVLGLLGAIPALLSKDWCYKVLKLYCKSVFVLQKFFCGLTYEIRGEIPEGSIVVASKHQSFLDIFIHFYHMERPNFVIKHQLKYAPFLGWYAMRIGATPVKRGKKGKAMKEMVASAQKVGDETTQLVIYPQGTRVPPGKDMPYKVGAAVLAQRMNRPIMLAATNVGVFWPKRGLLRHRGVAVMEYLDWMPEGLSVEGATKHMEREIEAASNRLIEEARAQLDARG